MRTCKDCRSCGPDRPDGMIRCDHESWTHWNESIDRVFSPDFAPDCVCFEPKREKADCSPALNAYRAFHNARLENLNAFVSKRMKRMIRQGFNNSGPVQWECIYKGLKELPQFSERAVWEAAWGACLNEQLDKP